MKMLEGDAILLAGATGRVGATTIRTLLESGACVVVVSRKLESARNAIEQQTDGSSRDRVHPFEADLLRFEDGEAASAETVRRYGRIDAAISLAGGGSPFVPVAESTPDDLEVSVRNNLAVAYNVIVPALRTMLKQERRPGTRSRGRLVAVTAGSSLDPQPRFGVMGMGKAGVNTLMLAIARENKAQGIVANAVVLGGVATEAARDYYSDEDFAAASTPQEVADILAFHASDASSGVNGSLIHLNAREVD